MSEEVDHEDRTEDPSEKRLTDALEKGNVPQSREVSSFIAVLTILVCTVTVMPSVAGKFIATFLPFIETPDDIPLMKAPDAFKAVSYAAMGIGGVLLAGVGIAMALAIISAFGQGKFVFSSQRMMPDINRINPMKGFGRLASKSNLIEFLKGVVKVGAVIVFTGTFLLPVFETAESMVDLAPETVLAKAATLTMRLLVTLCVVTGLIAVVDRFWKQKEWLGRLRMTKQELKDEMKGSEGDPHVKSRRQEIARSRTRRRMMADVPTATVVVMNPTHYAVALRYVHGETPAPVCVAKGIDALALKIRGVAEKADVPVIENPPLARALYPAVKVGQPIPEDHYEAVANIISFVMGVAERQARR